MPFADAYRGKRVLLTGHTGFKGAWLAEWLLSLGAEVTGFALPPAGSPALFSQLDLASRLKHVRGDLCDASAVHRVVAEARPDFVFHLAAQALVRTSYLQPVETWQTNVMGTINVLEAVRAAGRPCVVVAVTSDKCYENREKVHRYREEDALGGHDPYSSSKAAAELAIAAYRRSFFNTSHSTIRLASARAGNVIGGGDWAVDRIVPDCMRALQLGQPINVRNKAATRSWQHVMEPLGGYLWLGARLAGKSSSGGTRDFALEDAFNFGPTIASNRTVADLVDEILKHWPGTWRDRSDPAAPHEAALLDLAIDRAATRLGWSPVWGFDETVAETVNWYRENAGGTTGALPLTQGQIGDYTKAARAQKLAWAD